jgi:hypothetical protein
MRLQCQKGTDEINHGGVRYIVSNISWIVEVPDHVGHFMLHDGRSGVIRLEEPEGNDVVSCPHCGFAFAKEK